MEQLEQQVINELKTLSLFELKEVLTFVEFLQSKKQQTSIPQQDQDGRSISFLEAAERYVGCVEGPGDLSINPKYMDGYGT
ncbi:MAG: hypothetical protein F6K16_34450 [Symploca sp. SIO2B6]|nr:hypothetical protein [Symploca sp. SIO2B6]